MYRDSAFGSIIDDDPSSITSESVANNDLKKISVKHSPNLAKDLLDIFGIKAATLITIRSSDCKIVLQQKISNANNFINLSKLVAGFYHIQFIQKGKMQSLKFIKKNRDFFESGVCISMKHRCVALLCGWIGY
ncbi:hypothetical protein BH10BAC2_BH10BAC2_31170 [soil metagenome]